MEVILDALQKNDVEIDMRTLSYHTNHLINHQGRLYDHLVTCVNGHDLSYIFDKMNVNNFGRAMTYLTMVYMLKESEDVTREAVRLVVEPLRNMDFAVFRVQESFSQKLFGYIRRIFRR